jgi:hypothetical protein
MAIGRVGSFATVEPALVDFGSMVERNIDKIKAEEQAKAAAKAAKEKADREALKDLKDVDAFKSSGFAGWDDSLGTYVHRLHQLSIDNKELYRETGDRKYLDNYDRIRNEVNTINNESNAIADKLKQIADLYSAGKINKTVYEEKIKEFQSLNEGKAKYAYRDGRTVIGFPDEEGNVTNETPAFGFVTNLANDMPEPFNINENINTIVEKVKASEIEKGGALRRTTITDINSPESESQRRRLDAAANLFSNQNSSMTEWYLLKRNEEKSKGNILPLKTSGWTEDERKEAKDFFYNQMINSYQKKVSIEAQQPKESGDGSGSGKKVSEPTKFNANKVPDYKKKGAIGRGLSWAGDPKNAPTLGSFMIDRTVGEKTTRMQVNNALLKNIFVNEDGNVIIAYDELLGTEIIREINEEIEKWEALLSSTEIQSEKNEINNKIKTLKSQSKKPKNTGILTIRRTDEDLIGMISNSLGKESTDELLSELDELAGYGVKPKAQNKEINLNASNRIKNKK